MRINFTACVPKNMPSVFPGHSIGHGEDSSSVVTKIEQEDRAFFDTKLFKVYVCVKNYPVSQKSVLGQRYFFCISNFSIFFLHFHSETLFRFHLRPHLSSSLSPLLLSSVFVFIFMLILPSFYSSTSVLRLRLGLHLRPHFHNRTKKHSSLRSPFQTICF